MRKYDGVEPLGDLLDMPIVATLATYGRDGSVATYGRDGTVLLSPVWHEWRDGGFNVTIEAGDVKARHVTRDARASLAVYESAPPYRGVELRGLARLIPEDASDVQRRIAIRYLGPELGGPYAAEPSGTEVTLRLEPGRLRAWDFADVG